MIRWLVAGAGQAGRCHIEAIHRTDQAEQAGVVDPVPPSALAQTEATAAVVASPNDTQVTVAAQFLRAGIPVLCEKPVGRSVDDAKEIQALSERYDIPAGVVLNQRQQRHNRWIKSQIQSDALMPDSISFKGRIAPLAGWHRDPVRAGGGVLHTIGLHYLDLCTWWLGPVQIQSAVLSGAPVEEAIEVRGLIGNKCPFEILIDASGSGKTGPLECVIEAGERGLEMHGHQIVSVNGLPDPPTAELLDPNFPFGPGHRLVIADATNRLLHGKPFPVPLEEVLPLLETIQAHMP